MSSACVATEQLPDLGQHLAGDNKAIPSHGRPHSQDPNDPAKGDSNPSEPGRRPETAADWGQKTRPGVYKDGTVWKKATKWFGYKLHLIADRRYELPVGAERSAVERVNGRIDQNLGFERHYIRGK